MTTRAPASLQFDALARDLYRMGPTTRRLLGARFQQIGQAALSDARSRASWSTRIPASLEGRPIVDTTRGRVGFEIRARLSKAPHGRVYEGIGADGGRTFRHPVFADQSKPRSEWTWTERNSKTRPFMFPAVRGRAAEIERAAQQTYEQVARECGFR